MKLKPIILFALAAMSFLNVIAQPTNLDFSSGTINGWILEEGGNQDSYSQTIYNIHPSSEYTVFQGSMSDIYSAPINSVSPLGGNFIRFGKAILGAGGNTYKLSQTYTVNSTSSSLMFAYATVMENGGHVCNEQNYFDIRIKDALGNIIPANFNNQSILNGHSCSSGDPSYLTFFSNGYHNYKNWTNLSYNLSAYIGTPITIEVLVAGCNMNQSAHAGYAYFDAASCSNNNTPTYVTINGIQHAISQANSTINLCNTSNNIIWAPVGATSFTWSGGAINGLTTQSVSITQPGVYHLTCNKPFACSNVTDVNFAVGITPSLSIISSTNAVCPGAAVSLSVTGASNYTWMPVSGTIVNSSISNTLSVAPQISSVYKVIGSDVNGCIDSINYSISVLPSPSLSITTNGSLCSGSTVTLTASGANSYYWTFNQYHSYNSQLIIVPNSTLVPVTLSGTLSSTGCSQQITKNIRADSIYITLNKTILCTGETTLAYAQGGLNYNWSTGDTTSMAQISPSVTTTYTVSGLTASCGIVQSVFTVTVLPLPSISINTPTVASCPGNYNLSATGAFTYTWSSGLTNNSNVFLNSTTSYTVQGTDIYGCKNTTVATYTILPTPTLTVTATPSILCVGNSATLTALGASSYTWNTGGIGSSIVVSPSFNSFYNVNGLNSNGCVSSGSLPTLSVSTSAPSFSFASSTYSFCPNTANNIVPIQGSNSNIYSCSQPSVVCSTSSSPFFQIQQYIPTQTVFTITATNGCGTLNRTVTVSPLPLPNITVSGPTITCDGNPTTYSVGGVNSFSMYPGNFTTTSTTVVVTPTISTTYTINGQGANSCNSSQTISVVVNNGLSVSANNYSICSGVSQTLLAYGANSYTWSTGANTNSIIVTPTANSVYTVSGSSSNGCVITKTISVIVNPSATFSVNSGSVCLGSIFEINPVGAAGNIYNYSSGTSSVSPTNNTIYTVYATNSYSCSTSVNSNVTVIPLPVISVNSGSICSGQNFTITPTGGTNYFYSTGSNVVSPTTSSIYTITGSDVNGCINTATCNVNVGAMATPITVNSGTICSGDTFTIMPSGATTYSYSSGTAVVSPSVTSDYTVTATSASSCISSVSVVCSVIVNQPPTISVNSGTICSGDNFTLVPSGASTYTFSSGSNIISPISNTVITVTGTDLNGCEDNVGVLSSIVVNNNPIVVASSSSSVVCEGTSVILSVNGANTYSWNTGEITSSISATPTISTIYSVTGTDINNCTNTQIVSVVVDNTCQDVWPGDANSDGWADNLDVLEMGLHYLQTGLARPAGLNNIWQSFYANNWTGTITNGKNVNHSDCNGDGTINDDDTLAIFNNYGLNHAFRQNNQLVTIPELSIVPDQPTVIKGTWGSSSIYLGEISTPVNNINGIAFTVNFDNALIEPNSIWVEYPNSFINSANQNLHFRKLDFAANSLFTATTHTINNNVSGNGLIGILHYKILSSLSTDQVLLLELFQGYKSEISGLITPLTTGTGTLMAIGASVGLQELNGNLVSISPNPTNGSLTINTKTELQKIEVIAITGQTLLSEIPTNVSHTLHLDNFANGIYFVNLYQNNRIVKREKVVLNK